MADETQTTTEAAPASTAAPAPDLAAIQAELEALKRTKNDLLSEVKKLKGASRAADETAKTAEQLAQEKRDLRAQLHVFRALNSEGIKVDDEVSAGVVSAILNGPGVKIGDDGTVEGVGDALAAFRKAGFFGGVPVPAKPEASPAMAKPKANAEPIDPKYAKVETLNDLLKLGVEAFNEFKAKYPERLAALPRAPKTAPVMALGVK